MNKDFLTPQELAERWSITTKTLANWRSDMKGPSYVKVGEGRGSPVIYKLKDVIAYENSHTMKLGG